VKTAAAFSAAVPFVVTARAEETARKLGFALVGLGGLATHQIAPALAKSTKLARLAAIVTGTPSKKTAWQARYGIPDSHCYTYETFDSIRDNPDVDVVYVVLPNSMHHEFALRAAKAGKHVYTEKPMALSTTECRAMIDACKSAKVRLGVGYRCQFTPHHLEMIRIARDRDYGRLKVVEAAFGFGIGDPGQWRLRKALAGGGALMDVGIYAIQGMRHLVGEEPVEVSAMETRTDPMKFAEVDETIAWQFRFPDNVVAHGATTYAAGGMNYLRGIAERGMFELSPNAYGYDGLQGRSPKGPFDLPQPDQFAAEMDDFSECILRGRPTRVPGEEGLADLRAIEAIYRSIAEGRTVKV
jgi:predicted dehydrogenase